MMYGEELIPFLKSWEGLKLVPSPDRLRPDIIDIGHGHVILEGEDVRSITEEEADALLRWDLEKMCAAMDGMILVPLTQYQADALISFSYNLGTGALGKSTLLRYVNEEELDRAAEEFPKWAKAGGNIVRGLLRRREAERAMFEAGSYEGRP